ncbi:cell division protein FtsH [Stieleria varia]|uniref:ATP-dependent zinc metalloprotease FtsH n=1 Tax=Stieleria varia TaxID=2528005 RepID=A0A5C6AS86_9BACT|nr:cell division protein FtsH [Stieleria varia]TWU02361.1 ATP-dependent zinc metalloprotease FtsH [Stieleria varia]
MNDETGAQNLSDDAIRHRLATAYHEAGHAVMALSLGRLIQKITIEPSKTATGISRLGLCEFRKGRSKASKTLLDDQVLILFAGMVAEARFTGEYCQAGAAQDLREIRNLLANRASNERQLEKLQRRMLEKTEHLLFDETLVRAIESIALELMQKTTISGRAARHLFEHA